VTWDPDRPGCAPETCGGTSYDPCVTVMRTRGRWHDGQVPATAVEAAAAVLHAHLWLDELGSCRCGLDFLDGPDSMERWALHAGSLATVAVADWLRAKEGAYDNRAAGLIDPLPRDPA